MSLRNYVYQLPSEFALNLRVIRFPSVGGKKKLTNVTIEKTVIVAKYSVH